MAQNNKGFTLIEVIVVVVILTVLMTIVVPVLYSYLDHKDEDSVKEDSRLILLSAQNAFSKLYTEGSHSNNNDCVISGDDGTDYIIGEKNYNKDCDIHMNQISVEIFSNAGFDISNAKPYVFILGVGNYETYAKNPLNDDYDPKKAYTIYTLTILNTLNDEVIFWTYDKGFTKKKPYMANAYNQGGANLTHYKNLTDLNGELISIQYYFIKSGDKNDKKMGDLWTIVKNHYNTIENPS